MAPIRRYLRITKYSVLECRIYLDNPALAHSWLLNPRDPVLPRVIESVRPLVLPKLREERERARKKSTKKRGIKDVIVADDFEVSIFLTETSTRHSLLYKHKHFRDTTQTRLTSNSGRLTGATREVPIDIDEREQVEADVPVQIRQEDSDDDAPVVLDDIPSVSRVETSGRPKRRRRETGSANEDGNDCNGGEISNDDDGLFVTDDEHSSEDGRQPPSKRLREGVAEDEEQQDDKKKMAMDISYEGFSIYGRVLCLVVKKRETAGSKTSSAAPSSKTTQRGAPGGQAVMENWITSTQLPEAVIPDGPDAS